MKFTFWILSVLCTILVFSCVQTKAQTAAKNPLNDVDKCPKDNSFPVCGTNGTQALLFGNECLLNEDGDYTKTTLKSCLKDCEIICLGYYDPVCVTNPVTNATRTFNNKCEAIKDACQTDNDWIYKKQGKCSRKIKKIKKLKSYTTPKKSPKKGRPKPIPCPKIFNPVCAVFNGVKSTFINECLVNAENVNKDKDWRIFSEGICEEDYTSVSKMPKDHHVEKRSLNLNEFENFENAFHLGEPITFIRPPPIFQTHFIKNEDSEGIFNREESNLRSLYEDQFPRNSEFLQHTDKALVDDFLRNANTERPLMAISNPYAIQLPTQDAKSDFSFNEMLENLPKLEAQTFYQPEIPAPTAFSSTDGTCKLGSTKVCCSFQHKTRTFKNMCELISHNELTREDWKVEHNGVCKNCNFICSSLFEPLCISMNGLQYTIRNECILNAAMCKNAERDWKIIKKGVCDQYVMGQVPSIKDKYASSAPGFRFTSNYRDQASTTTEIMSSTTTERPAKDVSFQNIQTVKSNKKKSKVQKPRPFQIQEQNSMDSFQNEAGAKSTEYSIKDTKTTQSLATTNDDQTTKEYIFVLQPLSKNSATKSTTNSMDHSTTVLMSQIREHFSTTSTPLADLTQTQTSLKHDNLAEIKRLSIYGPSENSIMGTLLKAIQGSSKIFSPNRQSS